MANDRSLTYTITGDSSGAQAALEATTAKIQENTVALYEAEKAAMEAAIADESYTAQVEALNAAVAADVPIQKAETAALNETATAQYAAAAATDANREAQQRLSIEASLARGSMGGLARAIASTGGAFAEIALPILIVDALFRVLPQVIKPIKDILDSLGITFGSLSESAETMTATFEKSRKGMTEFHTETQVFKSILDLAAASSIPNFEEKLKAVAVAQDEAAKATVHSTEAQAVYDSQVRTSTDVVADWSAEYNKLLLSINALRVGFPSTAAALTEQLEDLAKNGVAPTDLRFESLKQSIADTQKVMEDHIRLMKDVYGDAWKDVQKAIADFSAKAQDVSDKINVMSSAGLRDQQIIKLLGNDLAVLADVEAKYGGELAKNFPELQAKILALRKYWEGQDAVTKALQAGLEQEHRQELQAAKVAESWDKLRDTTIKAIEDMRKKRDEDIASIDKQTEKVVTDIHKQEDTLQQQYQQGLIDTRSYRTQMDQLILDGVNATTNAEAEKEKLNKAEEKSEQEKVDKFADASADYANKLAELNTDYNKAEGYLTQLHTAQKTVTDEMKIQIENIVATHAPADKLADIMKDNVQAQKDMKKGLSDSNKALVATAKAHAAAAKAASIHAKAARAIKVR